MNNRVKFLLLGLIALLAGCSQMYIPGIWEQENVEAFEPAKKSDRIAFAEPAELGQFEEAENALYRVGAGDRLKVDVWGRPELSGEHKVGPDGLIQLPLAGSLKVAGLTQPEMQHEVYAALGKFYVEPSVTTQVTEFNANRVTVLGRVENPGVIQFDQPPTLLETLAKAGSLPVIDKEATLTRVAVFRGREKIIWVDMRNLLNKGMLNYNIRLKPNDLVYIPDSDDTLVYVMGSVHKPGAYRLTPDMSLLDALAQAGGPDEDAAPEYLALYRPGSEAVQRIPFSNLLTNRPAQNYALNEGDVLYVPRSGLANVGYALRQLLPGLAFFTFFGTTGN